MTIVVRPQAHHAATNDDGAIERLTLRYNTAYVVYRHLVDENAEHCLSGGRLSQQARYEEEVAFEELDSARYALLEAAAQAYPTIH